MMRKVARWRKQKQCDGMPVVSLRIAQVQGHAVALEAFAAGGYSWFTPAAPDFYAHSRLTGVAKAHGSIGRSFAPNVAAAQRLVEQIMCVLFPMTTEETEAKRG
jgi:hypothetical protein